MAKWCEYFNCSCKDAKEIDDLGECNHDCKKCEQCLNKKPSKYEY